MALGIAVSKWLLIGFSVISVAVTAERCLQLSRAGREEDTIYERLHALAAKGDVAGIQKSLLGSVSPTALAVQQGIATIGFGADRLREGIGRGINVQTAHLQNHLQYLATIASTAPYIGLFGTVLGILEAFRKIAATGETGPAVVSGSISEALVTTALGLGVAIPAAIAYNLLLSRVNSLSLTVENHSMEIADALSDYASEKGVSE